MGDYKSPRKKRSAAPRAPLPVPPPPAPPGANPTPRPRPQWRRYFLAFARLAATRSSCLRRQVGAVIVKDRQILATGYNGCPRGFRECCEVGCLREKMGVPSGQRHELCRGLHAEQNTIIQAARHGICIKDSAIYVTIAPCAICAKMIINAGIVKVTYQGDYSDSLGKAMLTEAGVMLFQSSPPKPKGGGK